jgi:hypothetical protein
VEEWNNSSTKTSVPDADLTEVGNYEDNHESANDAEKNGPPYKGSKGFEHRTMNGKPSSLHFLEIAPSCM